MRVLFPTTITAAMVTASSAVQLLTGQALWSASSAYTTGASVLGGTELDARIYSCIADVKAPAAGGSNLAPKQDKSHWTSAAPGNRWAMFDKSVNTRTTLGANWSITLKNMGRCNGLALVDVMGTTSFTVTVTQPKTAGMVNAAPVTSNYAEDITVTKSVSDAEGQKWVFNVSLTNALSAAVDLGWIPPSLAAKTDVALQWPAGSTWTVQIGGVQAGSIGSLVVGNFIELGDVDKDDLGAAIEDYSRIEIDEFGVASLVQRPYHRSLNCSLLTTHERVRFVHAVLTGLRATPAFFVASDDYRYSPFNTWGYVDRAQYGTSSGVYCPVQLSIKGISQE
jgi:hypothetical protein